jgi:hypothetical protein
MRSKFQSLERSNSLREAHKAQGHSSSSLFPHPSNLGNSLRRHHKSRASAPASIAPSSPIDSNFLASNLASSNRISNTSLITSNSIVSDSIFSDSIVSDSVVSNSLISNSRISDSIVADFSDLILSDDLGAFWFDDSMASANNLGSLVKTKVTSGFVGGRDTQDYFKLSLGAVKPLHLHLTGLKADADVQLFNSSGMAIASSTYASTTAEAISFNSLGAGDYYVRVYQFSGDTQYNLSFSTVDWYDQNLSDVGLVGQARSLYWNDGFLSRNDMMGILREAKDYGSIDATELTDLRKIVSANTGFGMPEYVRVLANKVVNSDPANTRSQIGNLFAGSDATRMESLISKWFLGSDRPTALSNNRTTAYGYRYTSGSLFQNSVSVQDIDQNDLGDCYFLASLGATANRSPGTIQNMFIDNRDGTFTVRFFNSGTADYVTVDRYLPTDAWGNAVFAGWGGGSNAESDNELWVALAEKAYAQINESGWIGQDNTNSYNGRDLSATAVSGNSAGINSGWPYNAMRHITGQNTSHQDVTRIDWWPFPKLVNDLDTMINTYNLGRLVVLNTKESGVASDIVANHSYIMTGYNSYTQCFQLYNPWGSSIELTRNQIFSNFDTWDCTA